MTPEDLDPHTYDVSSQEHRDKLLAATLAHVEAAEAQYRLLVTDDLRTGRWKVPLALAVLVLSAVVALFPPPWLSGPPPPRLDAVALQAGTYASLAIQAEQVRAFQVRNGRLPSTLDELPVRLPDVRYIRSNNRVFQFIGPGPAGPPVVFDAAGPDPRFAEAARMFTLEPGS